MLENIKIEQSWVEDFGKHEFFLVMWQKNPELYLEIKRKRDEMIARISHPSLGWNGKVASLDRFYEILVSKEFDNPLIISIDREEFKLHFQYNCRWKVEIIWAGQLNVLARLIHELAMRGILLLGNKKYAITSLHFKNNDLEGSPITSHDLAKAKNQGLSYEAEEQVGTIIDYILVPQQTK
jgi:hypothetical protein